MRKKLLISAALLMLTSTQPMMAAPTLEEQALSAVLEGRFDAALKLLEGGASTDPLLRWVAGRVALEKGELDTAARLFEGDSPEAFWGRVDVLRARGKTAEATKLTLEGLDRALNGEQRSLLCKLMLDQARELSSRDTPRAAALLDALLELQPGQELQRSAEDLYLSLDPHALGNRPFELARKRLSTEPSHPAARVHAARALSSREPARALRLLEPVLNDGPEAQALEAASLLPNLDVPTPQKLALLERLSRRFPQAKRLPNLRLTLAQKAMQEDESLGAPALESLFNQPEVASEARDEWARNSQDPEERRQRWLQVASHEGASEAGEKARDDADRAARESLIRLPAGAPRQAAAQKLLAQGVTRDPLIHYEALAQDQGRTVALWELLTRFPRLTPACEELASRLLDEGATELDASRFEELCNDATSPEARILVAYAQNVPLMLLERHAGKLEVLVTPPRPLTVLEHRVEPEAILRAAQAHPLEAPIDAYLISPDLSYELPAAATGQDGLPRLKRQWLAPRLDGALAALTVRAEELRSTSLVTQRPLRLEMLQQLKQLAVLVLDGNTPVPDAELSLLDAQGKLVRVRTDAQGLAVVDKLEGQIKLMAKKDQRLGFGLTGIEGGMLPTHAAPTLLLLDKAVETTGRPAPVMVVVPGYSGPLSLSSYAPARAGVPESLLESVPLQAQNGVAVGEIFAVGGGRLFAQVAEGPSQNLSVPAPATVLNPHFAVQFEPVLPGQGEKLSLRVFELQPQAPAPVEATLTVTLPWGEKRVIAPMTSEGVALELDLSLLLADEKPNLSVAMGQEHLSLPLPSVPEPALLPPTLAHVGWLGQVLTYQAPPDAWLKATHEDRRQVRWVPPGAALSLPRAGKWEVVSWREGRLSPPVLVQMLAPEQQVDAQGRWTGSAPALVVRSGAKHFQASVRLPGQPLAPEGLVRPPEAAASWLSVVSTPAQAPETNKNAPSTPEQARTAQVQLVLPLTQPREGLAAASGTLKRGKSTLVLGAGLPEGSRLYAYLHDVSDHQPWKLNLRLSQDLGTTRAHPRGVEASRQLEGQEIASALLAEEAREAEAAEPKPMDFEKAAAEELAAPVVLGGMMGGLGSGSASGMLGAARQRREAPALWKPELYPPSLSRVLASRLDVGPGAWELELPSSVTAARLVVMARTPEGRWLSLEQQLTVQGSMPVSAEEVQPAAPAPLWKGDAISLLALVERLPLAERAQVLATSLRAPKPLEGRIKARLLASAPEALAGTVGGALAETQAAMQGLTLLNRSSTPYFPELSDSRRVERARQALAMVPFNAEKARTMALRLLEDPALEPWARARAGLTLWATQPGELEEVLTALSGDSLSVQAARVVVQGKLDNLKLVPSLWRLARSEEVLPEERALALQALVFAVGLDPARLEESFRTEPVVSPSSGRPLKVEARPPLAYGRGILFERGTRALESGQVSYDLPTVSRVPAQRWFPVQTYVEPSVLPTRVVCPQHPVVKVREPFLDLPPSVYPQEVICLVALKSATPEPVKLELSWYAPLGERLGSGGVTVQGDLPRESALQDAMSLDELLGLSLQRASRGDAEALARLQKLQTEVALTAEALQRLGPAMLEGARLRKDMALFLKAFEAIRERDKGTELSLELAAEVARAFAAQGNYKRALAGARTVLDARFTEELAVIQPLENLNLRMVSFRLARILMQRSLETPAVEQARYLFASSLLATADEGQRGKGFTPTSLRLTAVGELSRFLLLYPQSKVAPEAAALLLDTLERLRAPERVQALAGRLAQRYKDTDVSWQLALADVRSKLAQGQAKAALGLLEPLVKSLDEGAEGIPPEALSLVRLEQGRVLEALGRVEDALEVYDQVSEGAASGEAVARAAYLRRSAPRWKQVEVQGVSSPRLLQAALRPGASVEVTAYRIALESLVLQEAGQLNPEEVRVDGLRPAAVQKGLVNVQGEVPLPTLPEGAYLLSVLSGGIPYRTLLIRSNLRLERSTDAGQGLLLRVVDEKGRGVPEARLWLFGNSELAWQGKTDALGSVFLAGRSGGLSVLARLGDKYAWLSGEGPLLDREDEQTPMELEQNLQNQQLLENNAEQYRQLFDQQRVQVKADML
ncbi:MAG: hypothetical protein ACKO6N_11170 [Myxococcota bacterium]